MWAADSKEVSLQKPMRKSEACGLKDAGGRKKNRLHLVLWRSKFLMLALLPTYWSKHCFCQKDTTGITGEIGGNEMNEQKTTQDNCSTSASEDISAIVKRAEAGDTSALPALREVLDQKPQLVEDIGNLALQAERSLIDAMSGNNLMAKESLRRKLTSLRGDLAGVDPTPLERLLVERVVACWLQVQYADILYAQRLNKGELANISHIERLQEKAHNRYISAIKALAQIRRLDLPALQLNIADKQINIG